MFSFNIAEEKKALSPEYILFPSDEAMVLSVFSKVDDLSLRLGCTRDKILIVVTERSLLSIIIKQGEKMKKPFEQLVRRGDYTTITKAEKHNRYVIGYIDYIGGLEFDAVVIVKCCHIWEAIALLPLLMMKRRSYCVKLPKHTHYANIKAAMRFFH